MTGGEPMSSQDRISEIDTSRARGLLSCCDSHLGDMAPACRTSEAHHDLLAMIEVSPLAEESILATHDLPCLALQPDYRSATFERDLAMSCDMQDAIRQFVAGGRGALFLYGSVPCTCRSWASDLRTSRFVIVLDDLLVHRQR